MWSILKNIGRTAKPAWKKFTTWFKRQGKSQNDDKYGFIEVWWAMAFYAVTLLVRLFFATIWYAVAPAFRILFGWVANTSMWQAAKHRITRFVRRVWP